MKQINAYIVENEKIAAGSYRLRLLAPYLAESAMPGQFVHVRLAQANQADENDASLASAQAWDPLLRRPLSLMRLFKKSGEVELLYNTVGRGTTLLTAFRPGERLDILGPLGKPFGLAPKTRRLLLIGGGVGLAPLIALAEEAIKSDVSVTLLAGFASASRVYSTDLIPPEVEYVVCTDDATMGRAGFVTTHAAEFIAWADAVVACGPMPMLKALSKLDRSRSLDFQVSLEQHMGCAMGVCLGCVIPTRHGLKRVCRDGPTFALSEVGWNDL